MKSYQAILTGGATRDIGQFPSQATALQWALQEYGGNVSAVREVNSADYQIVVNHGEIDPAWYVLGLAGLLLLLAKKTRKKRGRHVSARS